MQNRVFTSLLLTFVWPCWPFTGCMDFWSVLDKSCSNEVLFPNELMPAVKLDFPWVLKFCVVPPFLRLSIAFDYWFDPHAKRRECSTLPGAVSASWPLPFGLLHAPYEAIPDPMPTPPELPKDDETSRLAKVIGRVEWVDLRWCYNPRCVWFYPPKNCDAAPNLLEETIGLWLLFDL